MAQHLNSKPSELLRVEQLVRERYGLDGWWTAFQLDNAVVACGSKIESLASEFDDMGQPKYSLKTLLQKADARPALRQVSRLSRASSLIRPKPALRIED